MVEVEANIANICRPELLCRICTAGGEQREIFGQGELKRELLCCDGLATKKSNPSDGFATSLATKNSNPATMDVPPTTEPLSDEDKHDNPMVNTCLKASPICVHFKEIQNEFEELVELVKNFENF